MAINPPPTPPGRTCYACANAYLGQGGVYCPVFNEILVDVKADDCVFFESIDDQITKHSRPVHQPKTEPLAQIIQLDDYRKSRFTPDVA